MKNRFLIFVQILLNATLFAADYRVPRAAYSVYAADIDLDGDMDLVSGHNYCTITHWGGFSILRNNGYGEFLLTDSLYLYSGERDIQSVDLNGNNIPEIIAFNSDPVEHIAYIVIVYDNDMSKRNSFTLNTAWVDAMAVGDVDGDNDRDIVVNQSQGQFWGVLYNDATGNFSEPIYDDDIGRYPTYLACGDLDNDGSEDVVIRGLNLDVYLFKESGLEHIKLEENWISGLLSVFDIDLDGDKDILTHTEYMGNTVFVIFENLGDETFFGHQLFCFPSSTSHMFVADMNNDAYLDIVCANYLGIYVLYNQGGLIFSDPQIRAISCPTSTLGGLFCADFDGNGYLDVVLLEYLHYYIPQNVQILFSDGMGNLIADPQTDVEENPDLPNKFLLNNYPNPFNSSTCIQFFLEEDSKSVSIHIYNVKGELIRTLLNKNPISSGMHEILWDGRNDEGIEVPSGLYCCTMNNDKKRMIKKLLIVR